MKENELITVIVPVYNVEKYLEKCVKSIANQTYKYMEIILVDDGSKDSSGSLCDKLAETDERIIVVHKKNEGVSMARNTGIDMAKGEYLTFIDSDDYLLPSYIGDLYKNITEDNADIAINSFINQDEDKKLETPQNKVYKLVMEHKDAMETFLYQKHFTTSPWCKLFRKSLFENIYFPTGKLAQDMGTIYRLIDKADRVVYESSKTYVYIQRKTSIVHSKQLQREKDYIEMSEQMKNFVTSNYPELKAAAYSRFFSSNIQTLMDIPFGEIYKKEHKVIINNIKKYRRSVLKNKKSRTINRGCAFLSYPGIWLLKLCLNVMG